jgi:putative molybdopterin biosynthesis protein
LLLRPAAIYDTNGAIVTAAIVENGGDADFLGAIPDDEQATAMRSALDASDMLVLSGGTSKALATSPTASSKGVFRHHRTAWR